MAYERAVSKSVTSVSGVCRKEQLWPHVREFADRGIEHATNMLRKLQEVAEPCSLYTIHGEGLGLIIACLDMI